MFWLKNANERPSAAIILEFPEIQRAISRSVPDSVLEIVEDIRDRVVAEQEELEGENARKVAALEQKRAEDRRWRAEQVRRVNEAEEQARREAEKARLEHEAAERHAKEAEEQMRQRKAAEEQARRAAEEARRQREAIERRARAAEEEARRIREEAAQQAREQAAARKRAEEERKRPRPVSVMRMKRSGGGLFHSRSHWSPVGTETYMCAWDETPPRYHLFWRGWEDRGYAQQLPC
jgi:hypothetical protein